MGGFCQGMCGALDEKYMTSEQTDSVNLSMDDDDTGTAASMPRQSSDDSSFRKMTIADLDIDTIQWLSDDLQEGFALYDPDDRLVVANSEYIRLHSTVEDILKPGVRFEEMIRMLVIRGALQVPVGGEEEFISTRVAQHRNPSGTIIRQLANGMSYIIKEIRLADGSIICRENDITEIQTARKALQESEERFKSLAETASDWFWESDEHHRMVSLSLPQRYGMGTVEELIGQTRWEIAGADPINDPHWAQHKADMDAHRPFKDFWYSIVPSTGMSTHFRVSGSAVFNKSGLAIGYRSMPNDDGGRRHYSVSGVPVFDSAGNFTGYRGTSRDITKEILTERRAAAAHQRLLDAIEALPESFVLCDAEDRIVLCNSATYTRLPWCKTLLEPGMKYEDALREIALTGAAVGARGREEDWIREHLERHKEGSGERLYRRSDGRWVQITERKTADGGTVVIRADVTEEKQAEIEREAALTQVREENRAKSTFMANFSHELSAPVTQIAQLAQQLLKPKGKAKLTPSQRKAAEEIVQAAARSLRLVSDALDISRLQVGKYSLEPSDVDVADLIVKCCADARAGAGKSKLEIDIEIAPDIGSVHADETAMRHLLLSIIGNAWGDTAGASSICVTAEAVEDQIEIGVLDPVAELSETDLEILLRPFGDFDDRAAAPQTRNFGVGWAISSALAREIGAILSVASPPEGGTRVVLTMPRSPSQA